MPDLPDLTVEDITRWVGETSYARGRPYFRRGAVSETRREGATIKGAVQGTAPRPYRVELALGVAGIASGSCSCPVGWGGQCKHAAALLLAWIDEPARFPEVEGVDTALERLGRPELLALLRRLLKRSPDLRALLEKELSLVAAAQTPAPEAAGDIRQQVRRLVDRALTSRDTLIDVAEDVRPFLDRAGAALESGDARGAAEVYRAVAETTLEEWRDAPDDEGEEYDEYDDYYDGYGEEDVEGFANRAALAEIVGECAVGLGRCLGAMDDPEPRRAVLTTLGDIYMSSAYADGGPVGDHAGAILVERAEGEERQLVAARVRAALPRGQEFASYTRQRYGRLLLDLIGDTLDEAYLALCRETDLRDARIERLLRLGRTEEVAAEVRSLETHELLRYADLFVGQGQGALAASVVRERTQAPAAAHDFDDSALSWLERRAKATGDTEGALQMAETLFWRRPGVERYHELRDLARALGRWDALREQVQRRLATDKQFAPQTEIYLDEGEVDRALESLERLERLDGAGSSGAGWGYQGGGLRVRVARAAEEVRPEAAIELYVREVRRLIEARGRENYTVAAGHLQRVRALHRARGEGRAWQALVSGLRDQNRMLRALREEMEKAGLFEPEPAAPARAPEAPRTAVSPPAAAKRAPKPPMVRLLRAPDAPDGQY